MTKKLKKQDVRSNLLRLLLGILLLVFTFLIIMNADKPPQYKLSVGEISDVDIFAPRDVVDELSTERKREAAAQAVPEQYTVDFEMGTAAVQSLKNLLDATATVTAKPIAKVLKVQELLSLANAPDKTTAEALIDMTPEFLTAYSAALIEATRSAQDNGITDKQAAIDQIIEGLPEEYRFSSTEDLLARFLVENKKYDEQKTNEEREKARLSVTEVTYKKNQELVRRGTVITEEQLGILDALGLLEGGKSYFSTSYLLGLLGFLLISFMLCGVYLWLYRRDTLINFPRFLMTLITFLLQIFVFFVLARINSELLVPISIAAILLSVFTDVRVSIVLNVFIGMIGAVIMDGDTQYLIAAVLVSTVAAMLFRNIRTYSSIAVLSLYHGGATALITFSTSMLFTANLQLSFKSAFFGFCASLLSGILSGGLIPFFQLLFDIATPLKLTELTDPNKKLLRRLTMEAPGTYHHSLMVANLAEAACAEIGANGLLARVSALYHDIGKLEQPVYFKENQLNTNPHDALSPEQSAGIIIHHVSYGARLAREHRLPREIRDIIAQHHGTTKAAYFYKLALLRQTPMPKEEDFTYPGPKPQTKESAILMLADSCEASVRALDDKSTASVEKAINGIIDGKITEGQLDDCPITLSELSIVASSFSKLFAGYFHDRIKYDDAEIKADNERRNASK